MTNEDDRAAGQPRMVHLTGLLGVALFVLSALIYGNYDFMPPTSDILAFFEGANGQAEIAAYVGFVGAFFMMWFAGSVRSFLLTGKGEEGRLASPAFGGAIAAGAVMLVGYAAIQAAGVRAATAGGISEEAAGVLFDFYSVLFGGGLPAAMAVLVGASSVSMMRTAILPRWFGFAGVVVTVGMISPLSFIFIGFGALWVAVLSIFIYLRWR